MCDLCVDPIFRKFNLLFIKIEVCVQVNIILK